jgi:hypothetical protein
MQERVTAERTEAPEPAASPSVLQPPAAVAQVLALQRSAGNQAVIRMLSREPVADKAPDFAPTRFVFILGPKDDAALKSAEAYYRSALMTSHMVKVLSRKDMTDPTLSGVFAYLDTIRYPIAEISLVTHGSGTGELSFPLNREDDNEKVTTEELDKALHDGVLRPLSNGLITSKTRIRLQACFAGHTSTMVNLLDRAFGEGAGTVIAPTEEVAYSNDTWHSEGISGWWVWAPEKLSPEALSTALQAKYGKSVKLDLSSYLEDTGEHHKGEAMKSEAEMWLELSRKATITERKGDDGKPLYLHVANLYTQKNRPEYEDDPVLYTKSDYKYSPTDI